jgi:hypothetical protein
MAARPRPLSRPASSWRSLTVDPKRDRLGPGLEPGPAFALGPLQWVVTLIVSGIGALVLVYCAWYVPADEPGLSAFAGHFVAFAGAMLGLVISDDLLVLYVFWELTTMPFRCAHVPPPPRWTDARSGGPPSRASLPTLGHETSHSFADARLLRRSASDLQAGATSMDCQIGHPGTACGEVADRTVGQPD